MEKGDHARIVNEVANLAVGSQVTVAVSQGEQKATIPVLVRLRTIGMDPDVIGGVLALGAVDNRLSARFRKWRMGEISGFRDLLLNQDRIDTYRRTVMKDRSGYFRKAYDRRGRGLMATLMTGTPSI